MRERCDAESNNLQACVCVCVTISGNESSREATLHIVLILLSRAAVRRWRDAGK